MSQRSTRFAGRVTLADAVRSSRCALPTKYFYLCADCTRRYVLLHWTPSGIILVQRPRMQTGSANGREDANPSLRLTLHASAVVEEEFPRCGLIQFFGVISCPNRTNSTVYLSFMKSSLLLRALQQSCDFVVSMPDRSLIHAMF